jgi:predicted dehydrogenase
MQVNVSASKHTSYPWCPFDDYRIHLIGEKGISSITALYSSDQFAAELELFGSKGFLRLDLQAMSIVRYDRRSRKLHAVAQSMAGSAFKQFKNVIQNAIRVGIKKFETGHETIIKGFIEAVAFNRPVPVTGEEGLAAVEIMERIVMTLMDEGT